MNSPLSIFEVMKEGKPISKADADAAIQILKGMAAEAIDRKNEGHAIRIQDSIERIKAYRQKRRQQVRPIPEILKDIEDAQEMVQSYRISRRYETAAKWEHNRDEYTKEYDAAVRGKVYVPELKEVDGNVKERAPEGFQLCI